MLHGASWRQVRARNTAAPVAGVTPSVAPTASLSCSAWLDQFADGVGHHQGGRAARVAAPLPTGGGLQLRFLLAGRGRGSEIGRGDGGGFGGGFGRLRLGAGADGEELRPFYPVGGEVV